MPFETGDLRDRFLEDVGFGRPLSRSVGKELGVSGILGCQASHERPAFSIMAPVRKPKAGRANEIYMKRLGG
jgi:hypothetical protein